MNAGQTGRRKSNNYHDLLHPTIVLVLDADKDKVYKTNATEQQIVWALGPLNSNFEAAKHFPAPRGRISGMAVLCDLVVII